MTDHNSLFDGLTNSEVELTPEDHAPTISNFIQRTIGRLLGWNNDTKMFLFLRADQSGRLFVSSGDTNAENIAYANHTITTTPTLLLSNNAQRKQYVLQNRGSNPIYFGFDDTVTSTSGFLILENGSYGDDLYTGSIYAVVASGSQQVNTIEYS